MNYFILFILIISTFNYIQADDSSEEKSDNNLKKPVLEKFVKLVEDHKLNVTLFSTEDKYYKNGNLKESVGIASNFPPNHEITPIDTSTLSEEIIDAFLKFAEENHITAYSRTIKIENGKIVKEDILTKSSKNVQDIKPKASVYKWFTHVENGQKGFHLNDESYGILNNFIITGNDGKNRTVTTLESHIETKVRDKSASITDNDLKIIEHVLPKIQIIFNENEDRARALVEYLDEKLPENDWQVITNPIEYEVSSSKYVVFDAVTTYLIFALNK